MMARRCVSFIAPHSAISFSVRPQPTQRPLRPLTAQTWTQGEEIGWFTGATLTRPPAENKEKARAASSPDLIFIDSAASECVAAHQLEHRTGALSLDLELVIVAGELIAERVELVEDLVLGLIEQV